MRMPFHPKILPTMPVPISRKGLWLPVACCWKLATDEVVDIVDFVERRRFSIPFTVIFSWRFCSIACSRDWHTSSDMIGRESNGTKRKIEVSGEKASLCGLFLPKKRARLAIFSYEKVSQDTPSQRSSLFR